MTLLIGLSTLLLVTGCGSSGKASGNTGEENSKDLTFWGPWDGETQEQIQVIVDGFNKENDANVKYVSQADMMNTFQASSISGDVPDVMLWDGTEVRRYAKMNQLEPLDSYMEKLDIPLADYNDQAIDELTYDKEVYGIPINIDIWGVYCNLDILNKAGIKEVPKNWEELEAAAVASMDVAGVKTGLNMKNAPGLFNSFLVANNGSALTADGKKLNLNENALQTLEFYKKLLDDKVYSTDYSASKGSDGFLTGEEAMTFWPTSMLRTYKKYGDKMNFTFVPIPAGEAEGAKAGGIQTSFSLVVPQKASNKELATKFIKYALHDEKNSLIWSDIIGGFSTLKSIQNDEKFANDPYLKNVLSELNNCKVRSDVPGFINLEQTCFIPEIEKMFEGSQTPQKTIQAMDKQGNELLKKYREEGN